MAFRFVLGAFLAAVAMFLWGFLFWTVLPFPRQIVQPLQVDEPVLASLAKAMPKSGLYMYPGMTDDSAEEFTRRHQKGPILSIMYFAGGANPAEPIVLATGFLHFFVSALLAAGLLSMALPALPRYMQRMGFITLCGLFAAVFIRCSDPIWFFYPWDHALLNVGYETVAWLLAGIVMAAIIRPAKNPRLVAKP